MDPHVPLLLAARHPEWKVSDEVQEFITNEQDKAPEEFEKKWLIRIEKRKAQGSCESAEPPIRTNPRAYGFPKRSRFAGQEKGSWKLTGARPRPLA